MSDDPSRAGLAALALVIIGAALGGSKLVACWVAAIWLARGRRRQEVRSLGIGLIAVGILVTVFLSNDATAIVLTPAVYAATRAAITDARGRGLTILERVADDVGWALEPDGKRVWFSVLRKAR